ncbi:hypothetical protein [Streptomyces sp. NPDC021356]|uniref:hypothetical protein n=1 Tax=Streptomyces sp. NPDC021356 TaxID=3154900 RepID=UPI0033F97223
MKTAVTTGGTDGTGHGLAPIHLQRGGRAVVVGTGQAKAGPGAWVIQTDLELIDGNGRLTDPLSAGLDTIDVLRRGAPLQRSTRPDTADGVESGFTLTHLSRFLGSHGLAGLLGRAADPVALDLGGAGPVGSHLGAPARRLHDCTREVLAR